MTRRRGMSPMSIVPEARLTSTVPEARLASTVPEARLASTVPEARLASTVPEAARQHAWPAGRPRPARRDGPARPDRPPSPVRPAGPGRTARPVRTGPSRPASGDQAVRLDPVGQEGAKRRARLTGTPSDRLGADRSRLDRRPAEHQSRTSFVLLLLGLLGVSLGCLLVVNTTLAANSITISDLQQANQTGTQQMQALRRQVAAAGSAAMIAKDARRMHMRPDAQLRILDLRTGEIIVPGAGAAPGVGAVSGPGAVRRAGERRATGPLGSGRRRR